MSPVRQVHLLHTNDLHSHLEQMSKIHTLVTRMREEWAKRGETGFLLDIGDHMDRVRLETEGTDGLVNRAILERSGYDLITLGNNELLTFSAKELKTNYEGSSFAVVSSNVVEAAWGRSPSWLTPWKILIRDGIRFGFLGATIPYDTVYELMGWRVQDPVPILRQKVEQLRDRVDVLIVLSHLGLFNDRKLAEQVSGIDIILGAHTHHLLEIPERVGSTLIAAAGKFGHHVGKITVTVDPASKKIVEMKGKCFSLDEVSEADEIQEIIRRHRTLAEKNLSRPIAKLAKPLPIDWKRESPLGNFLADSLREWVGAEIAIVNSGQLLGSLPAGPVSRKQLHQICPHPINPVLLKIQGQALRRTLEESLMEEYMEKAIRGFGFRGKILGFMCVSGLRIVYDPNAGPYQKIRSIYVGEKRLRDDEQYDIATIDMFTFGAGYMELKDGKLIKYFLPEFLRDLLARQLQKANAPQLSEVHRWHVV
ncbi:bifunctional metallophosphatase/5'-nucleotidase [Lihuaxuella thermophila]|uniref:2',3'-cyclic-nucleotide 2'-phosphodiesterase/5'-or 3'-nucleotidase, 5'-nucleotidase family n=1 Tax=Lihuaxuella thermophila TaxID=1173111 RepID=A0A1H8IVY7_9BACL|nr:bifunctional UDP-sugar hydrolase/5'-nucleotidase [Lihuaxuella thermophila]SEN72196.1 2',3'-cyclic-nucleotide 2'-phosphodiesterase/5'-or 3'-nucleotidase, 5'-nucleotidase family [Lihuaxuella thermophila]